MIAGYYDRFYGFYFCGVVREMGSCSKISETGWIKITFIMDSYVDLRISLALESPLEDQIWNLSTDCKQSLKDNFIHFI